jgi:hypothetical protein
MRAKCENGRVALDAKTWYPLDASTQLGEETEIHECFNDECCVSYNVSTRVRCNGEKGYYGPLCGACDRDNENGLGFFTRSGRGCAKCWPDWVSWPSLGGIVAALLLVIGYLAVHHSFAVPQGEYVATVQKIMFSHLQMLGVLGIFKARGTAVFNAVMSRPAEVIGGSFTSVLPIKCAIGSQSYGPFLLNMALPVLLLLVAAIMLIPKTMFEKLMRKRREGKEAPAFKGKLNLPRNLAVCAKLRLPMTPADEAEWHGEFYPTQRFSGVAMFVLFTLYPTLVASIAAMFNCTAPIEGVPYLVADLTVRCYEGWHIGVLVVASIGAVMYNVGIPLVIAIIVALRFPVQRNADGSRRCAVCERRDSSEYLKVAVRSRYAFLYNGYATDRSGVVVAWEAFVMLRKLAVTLAGSVIQDPYLQILVALLILVVSCVATALVQPYETLWLNLLDTLGLFALTVTQIVSIIYFYAETAATPFADPKVIEASITALLFVVNALSLLAFFGCFGSEMVGLRKTCFEKKRKVLKVASAAETDRALAPGGAAAPAAAGQVWCHPSGVTVTTPPTRSADGTFWIWSSTEALFVASKKDPELLFPIASVDELVAGTEYRLVLEKTRELSAKRVKPRDVGGCGSAKDAEAQADGVQEEDGGVELQLRVNVHARDAPNPLPLPPGDPGAAIMAVVNEQSESDTSSETSSDSEMGGAAVEHAGEYAGEYAVEHPRGWTATFSAEHRRAYYKNNYTGESTWDVPEHPAPPEGWRVLSHEAHGYSCYYENTANGERQWHHPHDAILDSQS